MDDICNYAGHQFHIPVMGTGFTIDTPLRVARFGISSVISLVDDVLIEKVRRYHALREGEPYEAIRNNHPDSRAARITAYLNLVGRLVERQVEALKNAPFEPRSEIQRFSQRSLTHAVRYSNAPGPCPLHFAEGNCIPAYSLLHRTYPLGMA